MTTAEMLGIQVPGSGSLRPSDEELDLCTVHPQVVVHGTSLPDVDSLTLRGTRLS